ETGDPQQPKDQQQKDQVDKFHIKNNATHYEILGVSKTATPSEIKQAYFNKARILHPDKNSPEDKQKAEDAFKKLQDSYAVLSDENNRKKYDDNQERLQGRGQQQQQRQQQQQQPQQQRQPPQQQSQPRQPQQSRQQIFARRESQAHAGITKIESDI